MREGFIEGRRLLEVYCRAYCHRHRGAYFQAAGLMEAGIPTAVK